jgi:hypothetical protein
LATHSRHCSIYTTASPEILDYLLC